MKSECQKGTSRLARLLDNRLTLYIMLVVISISFMSTYSKIYDVKLDMNGDNIYYYSLGKALSEGKGFTNTMSFTESPHTHFPPGYPIFVAGVMKLCPNNINAVKIANGILLCASILLLFFLLKKISGDIILSFLTCLLCSMHAEILRYSTIMMSEMLFLFTSIGAIYLVLQLRVEQLFTKKGIRDTIFLLVLLFCMNYIYFVRTMGTSVILAIIIYSGMLFAKQIYLYLKNRKSTAQEVLFRVTSKSLLKYGLLFLLLTFSFIGTKTAWDIRNENVGKTKSDYIGDFKKKTNGQVMTTWKDWTSRINKNSNSYLKGWIPGAILNIPYVANQKLNNWHTFQGILVVVLVVLGLICLSQGAMLLFLYLGATLAVLLVWPEQYSGYRYFIAVFPFLIFLFLNGIKVALLFLLSLKIKKIPASLPAICIFIFALFFMFPAYSKALSEKKELAKYKTWSANIVGNAFSEFTTAMQWCSKNLPDSARVICRKPEFFYIYSGGRKSGSFSHYGSPEKLLQQLIDQKTTHVIIDHWFRHAYVTLYPLITTHYPDKFKFICKFESKNSNNEPPTQIFEFNPTWGYEGELVDGQRQGKGKFVFNDGRIYIGHFEQNQISGYGELYDSKENLLCKGIWKDNSLLRAQ